MRAPLGSCAIAGGAATCPGDVAGVCAKAGVTLATASTESPTSLPNVVIAILHNRCEPEPKRLSHLTKESTCESVVTILLLTPTKPRRMTSKGRLENKRMSRLDRLIVWVGCACAMAG